MLPLIDSPHNLYNIIAVQEPWLNPYINTTYCPQSSLYYLVFSKEGRTQVCLYISKRIPISKWRAGAEQDYCWVKLETDTGSIIVHNVYSEALDNYRVTE